MWVLGSGLIGGFLASLILGAVRDRLPNWLVTLGVTLMSLGASAFLFYVYFFVGSSRPDAELQMRYCLVLGVMFLAGGIIIPLWSLWAAVGRRSD